MGGERGGGGGGGVYIDVKTTSFSARLHVYTRVHKKIGLVHVFENQAWFISAGSSFLQCLLSTCLSQWLSWVSKRVSREQYMTFSVQRNVMRINMRDTLLGRIKGTLLLVVFIAINFDPCREEMHAILESLNHNHCVQNVFYGKGSVMS